MVEQSRPAAGGKPDILAGMCLPRSSDDPAPGIDDADATPSPASWPDVEEARLRALIARIGGRDETALGELYDLTHGRDGYQQYQ